MNIAMLSTFDSAGGAARSAYRLHQGLAGEGVSSRFVTQYNRAGRPDIVCGTTRRDKVIALLRPLADMIPMRTYPKRDRRQPFSTAYVPPRALVRREIERASLVHLHWVVHGFLSVEYLAKIKRPIVWTLHDSWAFTGGCHLPAGCARYEAACGACPQLGSRRDADLTRLNWRRKRRAWRDLDLAVVTPSRWLAERARASSLFAGTPVRVVPNGIDTRVFKPLDKGFCRDALGLPQDRHLILFGAFGAVTDANKGFDLFAAALARLPNEIGGKPWTLVVFGAHRPPARLPPEIDSRFLGTIADDVALALLYSAADVMVVPSRQENLPNTVMEAMACGTPAVAFRTGGIPDLIDQQDNGYLAEPFETPDLARGIAWCLSREAEPGRRARAKVEQRFAIEVVARQYVDIYRELLEAADGGV
jgi:glycosyltransferase involved in cell wall biosynthesis